MKNQRLLLLAFAITIAACTTQQNMNLAPAAFRNAAVKPPSHAATFVTDLYNSQVIVLHGKHEATIKGPRTHVIAPVGIAREPSGDLVVVNAMHITQPVRPGSVVTLPARAGDVHAKHVIRCHHFAPWGVAIDSNSNIWVTDDRANAILEYSPSANGCATPLTTISGAATQLSGPLGIALNSQGQIVVENFGDDSIEVFAAGASGDAAPIARISGPSTGIVNSEGLAVDAQDNIWITNYGSGTEPANVLEFDKSANGDIAPLRKISGSNTMLGAAIGIEIGSKTGDIYVGNGGTYGHYGAVLVFAPDANGNAAPIKELVQGSFPTALAGVP